MAWEHGNLKTDTNTYYNITLFLSVNIRKKLLVSRQISDDIKQFSYEIYQTIYGKDILNIYENNSGKNIPFGQMDILPVV